MSFFQVFFNGIENARPLVIPLFLRLTLLFVWIGVCVLIIVFRKRLSQCRHAHLIVKIAALILFVDQIILYLWQFLSGYFNLELSLPLYHCRIAVPLLVLDFVFGLTILRSIWIYWGALGSIFTMAIMDLYRFDFPHYTNFEFFIVHILLGWIVTYTIVVLDYRFEKKGLKTAMIVTLLFNVGLIFFNAVMNGTLLVSGDLSYNYGYMLFPPPPLKELALSLFPPFTFYLFMLIGYELLILVFYLIGRSLNKISDQRAHVLPE